MIITRTPFRMSFFGGGTDMPEFFDTYGGAVLSTTFDKYCYVNVRELPPPRASEPIRILLSRNRKPLLMEYRKSGIPKRAAALR